MWTVHQAAKILDYTESYIEHLCRTHQLECSKSKGQWIIHSLEYTRKGHSDRAKTTTINYLKSLDPPTDAHRRAYQLVIETLEGKTPYRSVLLEIQTHFKTYDILVVSSYIADHQIVRQASVRMALIRLCNQGHIRRVKKGVYTNTKRIVPVLD